MNRAGSVLPTGAQPMSLPALLARIEQVAPVRGDHSFAARAATRLLQDGWVELHPYPVSEQKPGEADESSEKDRADDAGSVPLEEKSELSPSPFASELFTNGDEECFVWARPALIAAFRAILRDVDAADAMTIRLRHSQLREVRCREQSILTYLSCLLLGLAPCLVCPPRVHAGVCRA